MRMTVDNVSTECNPELEILLRIAQAVERLVELHESQPLKRRKTRREQETLEMASTLKALREVITRDPSLTQADLAKRFDVDRTTISRWLKKLHGVDGIASMNRRGVTSKRIDGSVDLDGVHHDDETDE